MSSIALTVKRPIRNKTSSTLGVKARERPGSGITSHLFAPNLKELRGDDVRGVRSSVEYGYDTCTIVVYTSGRVFAAGPMSIWIEFSCFRLAWARWVPRQFPEASTIARIGRQPYQVKLPVYLELGCSAARLNFLPSRSKLAFAARKEARRQPVGEEEGGAGEIGSVDFSRSSLPALDNATRHGYIPSLTNLERAMRGSTSMSKKKKGGMGSV
ncbi:hypothetical protein B0T19DRAFT_215212 [Cercophora scortea]|uniref:Uncharacterized protein n=1 Tax=Cercophora scortea TaxID=314031 RepID=A0AAE0IGI0_9PEZI|nr:hypothetical protein B0T19DRAFT_215212 [Cercophora scortea]